MTADQPGGLEGVVGAEAAGLVEHALDGVSSADPGVGGALAAGQLEAVLGQVDADDPLGALQPAAGHRAEPTIPAPNTTQVEPGSTLAVFIAAPSPVDSPQANRQE